MTVQKGSSFEMVLPWTVGAGGYTTRINGNLLQVHASTSLLVSYSEISLGNKNDSHER